MPTTPVNLAHLWTDSPGEAFLPAQFRAHFCFTELGEQRPDRSNGCLLQLPLHGLDQRFARFPFQFACHKLYTHPAEYSWS